MEKQAWAPQNCAFLCRLPPPNMLVLQTATSTCRQAGGLVRGAACTAHPPNRYSTRVLTAPITMEDYQRRTLRARHRNGLSDSTWWSRPRTAHTNRHAGTDYTLPHHDSGQGHWTAASQTTNAPITGTQARAAKQAAAAHKQNTDHESRGTGTRGATSARRVRRGTRSTPPRYQKNGSPQVPAATNSHSARPGP